MAVSVRQYALVTAGYWAFTITDGALRMLVLLHFHDLGYAPVAIAFLFLGYEAMGVLTNLVGGWVGSRTGLQRTLLAGLALQVGVLIGLTLTSPDWAEWVSVVVVMGLQALSGVAKDLTKMSSKSAVKFVAGEAEGAMFRLVAILTGSKNALKGVGFFVGAALLSWIGYDEALWAMATALVVVLGGVALGLDGSLGRPSSKVTTRSLLSPSSALNRLSAARIFLFGARDIWFVVALPVFLDRELGWSFEGIGGFLAAWVIGYGMVQSVAPRIVAAAGGDVRAAAIRFAVALVVVAGAIAAAVTIDAAGGGPGTLSTVAIVGGLIAFGVIFAVNSSLHSYLVLAYSGDDVAMDVGFYYSANAVGRFVGTLLSGVLSLVGGLEAALWGSTVFLVICWALTLRLPRPAASATTIPITTRG